MIIRYNFIDGRMGARFLDLVEEQDSGGTLAAKSYYGHDFVYGNLFLQVTGYASDGAIHWDGDHYGGGRATASNTRLYFYDNTWVYKGTYNQYDKGPIFSIQDAGDDCPSGSLTSLIDVRNNIFYSMGTNPKFLHLASCGNTNMVLQNNWISPQWDTCSWAACSGTITGTNTFTSPANNDPGFVDIANFDAHLFSTSSALGKGAALAAEVTNNALGLDLTPNEQYLYHQQLTARTLIGAGSDLGALGQ
jgi:hypothetical protein